MLWNFPAIKTVRTVEEQYEKIKDEMKEYENEDENTLFRFKDKEAVDILHSVETFLRLRFKGREEELKQLIKSTIEKNIKRSYYKSDCY
jgi:hypothetical protein